MSKGNVRGIVGALVAILIATWLAACGSGGTSATGTTGTGGIGVVATGSATIQGQVSGTAFVAVDSDTNLEVGRVTAAGDPKRFSIAVPTGHDYRFYLVENGDSGTGGRIYPLYVGTSNVFHLDNGANGRIIDLGKVDPDLSMGHAFPANDPAGTPGVSHLGEDRSLPPSLAAAAYGPDDLRGTWDFHGLATSGPTGWMHGTLEVDGNGFGHMTSRIRNGMPLAPGDNVAFFVPPSGIVGMHGSDVFHGVLNGSRHAMFANWTDDTGANYLMVYRKRQGAFAQGDLYGTWRFHRLAAGAANVSSGWAYGTLSIAAPGTATIPSIRTSGGGTAEQGTSFPVSLDNNGILTSPGDDTFHGAMMPDRNMIVATARDAAGNYEFWMMVRAVGGVTYSGSDLTGDWMLHSVASGNTGTLPWYYGHMAVDGTGQAQFPYLCGPAGTYSGSPMAYTVDSSGIVTANAGGMWGGMGEGGMHHIYGETLYGVVSSSKDLAIMTWSDDVGGYRFRVHVK